ncbi:MAG: hypothetical protein DRI34_11780 [Deltaproteobacteria bacterium]|nr:MAG: hypothetical protein DRI34_11780 [Deltaproteobacteria bacterium]
MPAAMPRQVPAEDDPSQRRLVSRLAAGDEDAWREFLERYSNLIFSLLWRYARHDRDLCTDLYTYVLQALRQTGADGRSCQRFHRYLQSLERLGGRGRFTTWLGRVTQNLVSDYFRARDGRRTEPREIERMEPEGRELFRLLYWEGLSEREAFHTLASRHAQLSEERFYSLLLEINSRLSRCNRWALYSEVLRRSPAVPLHPLPPGSERPAVQVAESRPDADPDHTVTGEQQRRRARQAMQALLLMLQQLEARDRLLLIGRYRRGLTARQLGRLAGLEPRQVYSQLDRLKERLREELQQRGFSWEDLSEGMEGAEGMLELLGEAATPPASGRRSKEK